MSKQVIQIAKNQIEQTKSQKNFNRLIKKIEKLEVEITDFKDGITKISQRIASEYVPVKRTYNETRAEMVQTLDRAAQSGKFTKSQTKKLAHCIKNLAFELINEGFENLKEIYDRYDEDGYDQTNADAEAKTAEMMKGLMSMFGVDFDDDADVSTPQKMQEYMSQKIAENQAEHQEKQRIREQKQATRPKTAKQAEREEKKQIEVKNISKAVRTIYMDLVKVFHPDRETDQEEKQRKTEIMHRVTEAYEKSDLLSLLRLQLEFNRIDQDHLERLAEDQLKYYNKILNEQVKELEEELYELEMQAEEMTHGEQHFKATPFTMNLSLDQDIKNLKKTIKELKKDILAFRDDEAIKDFLKQYRIERKRNDNLFDFFM
jgi:hypothetical protein